MLPELAVVVVVVALAVVTPFHLFHRHWCYGFSIDSFLLHKSNRKPPATVQLELVQTLVSP
ncbi:hypothetical protein A2U01_0037787 [Trifolium medium]|uniref:Uncharacterized protein n=1 Tax=Trifolium medium TaxID=97028 RepID=A0A392PX08_9FABA|nr:hypothetical protein [Trifolium medium]